MQRYQCNWGVGERMTEVNGISNTEDDELRFSRSYRRWLWFVPLTIVVFPALFYLGVGWDHGRHYDGGPEGIWWGLGTAILVNLATAWAVFNQRYRLQRGTLTFGGFRRRSIHLPEVTVASVYHQRKRHYSLLLLVLDGQEIALGGHTPRGQSTPSYFDGESLNRMADALAQAKLKYNKDAVDGLRALAANPTLDAWPEPTDEPGWFSTYFKHEWEK